MRFEVEDVIAENDRAVVRWRQKAKHTGTLLGPETAGKDIDVTGVTLFRFDGGKIVELWLVSDDLGELRQAGVVSAANP